MKEKKTCFFIGHREADSKLLPMLRSQITKHILENGVTEFIVGRYGGFDALATTAVKEVKHLYPDITLTLLLPYHPAEQPKEMPSGFDGTYYPDGMGQIPKRFAISRANRVMVEQCDYLIAFAWHPASNSRELLEYARRREKKGLIQVTNLAELCDLPQLSNPH